MNQHFRLFLAIILFSFFSLKSIHHGTRFNDHERLFSENILVYPTNLFLYSYLAYEYEMSGQYDAAIRILNQGLNIDPNDVKLKNHLMRLKSNHD